MLNRTYGSMKKAVSLLALALTVTVGLVGCGSGEEAKTPAAEPQKQEDRVIKHAMGETKVPAEPKRVVILTNEGTEALLEMGVKPVGAVKSWTGDPWYPHIKSEMEGVKDIGDESQPNLEAIAALKPDLIIGNKMRQEKVYEQLNAIAPTVMSETLRGEWKNNFKFYSEALNKKAEGDKVLAAWDTRVAEFKKNAGDKLSTEISVVRFMPGKTRIYYNQTFSGIIFKELGLKRPEKQNLDKFSDDVTKERIPDMDGDVMFYFTYETGNGDASKAEKEWTGDALWQNLNVVKAGKSYKVDDVIWNTAGGVKAANLLVDDLEKKLLGK
ncbi:iron-siderophore ABC transporter substrate-binding protein [Tumebacillus sp. DT12]|uniref:Iron-siderophore ABC transporter substrate-binding protein n=1 Tax=Tumebacillus lacus TaxID=2995335 RepID=A0ABT3X5Y8_9BACL|nr:iron-siderophore ABC transporter substrate-binding protein [Tumebacillus lacus]MCX7571267.1 iron-siderophore ABC transporter substrate-binding protein [Tumebacillus lacus]